MTPTNDQFPTAVSDLPGCDRSELVDLSDGEAFDLRIAPVVKEVGDATVRMLAYNGSIPGPTLKVQQGSDIEVNVDQRRRPRGNGPLARSASGEPL